MLPRRYLSFGISIVRRIRAIPNDKWGIIYTDSLEAANQHEELIDLIVSISALEALKLVNVDNKYSITTTFVHTNTNLNPQHLYPSYFYTDKKEGIDDKIAGFKTTSYFHSPLFSRTNNPLTC